MPDPGDPTESVRDTDIAIVGIGARFPQAADAAEFHDNLLAGRHSVGPMPAERIAATGLNQEFTYLPMGHLDAIDEFDPGFFGLSRREASLIDPQQRLALVLTQRAIEDAGYSRTHLAASVTAVALTAAQSSYHSAAVDPGPLSMLGNAPFAGPARIAHRFGFVGACFGVDSGCNSALVAVHQACRELRCGDADYAVTGGVSVRVHGTPSWSTGTYSELMSPSGVCRAFDADADGTVNGEGGAILLLTTVRRALADGTPIHAVIRGSATRHTGAEAATISTPSAIAQRAVIEQAWRNAGLDPRAAGYLETHGSGTRLGDAVELEAIAAVFGGTGLPIGSVKTNIGHLDHAAGIAGLVKAALSVSRAQLYPSLHFTRATGGFDLEQVGIEVITEARPWAGAGLRAAGVSSFSLGGSVAHCVVTQAPPVPAATVPPVTARPRLVPVSARDPESLREVSGMLARALSSAPTDPATLDDVAATLAVGRDHHPYRRAIRVADVGRLVEVLETTPITVAPCSGAPRVVLLLSPDASPVTPGDAEPIGLPAQLPATGHTAAVLTGQLAFHTLLTACGIVPTAVLSAGSSRYAARYLLGSRDAVAAAELAASPPTVDRDRLLETVRLLSEEGPVVFLEPAPDGVLGALVAEAFPDADVVAATAQTSDAESLLGELYERGVDLDWSALVPVRTRRLRLPGHPLRAQRCWVDLPWTAAPALSPATSRPAGAEAPDSADPLEWLRATLTELLDTEDDIDADADFFGLGGNSLIAVQLVDRIEEVYGFRPKLLDVYERPRLIDFAELLAGGAAVGPTARTPIPALVAHDEPVMSSGQERMWFHHQFDPETTLYNYPVVQMVRGPIDHDVLRGTFDDLIERHETLRYNLAEADGMPVLRIRDRLDGYFRSVDVSGEADPYAAARVLVREAARAPFDLANEPLVRVLLITLAPDSHVLQLTCHHAVTDGATPTIVARELPELYAARSEARPHRLQPLPIRYRDYAAWHRALTASTALDHELDYWRETLAGAPTLRLPTDFPRPPRKTYVGDLSPFTIPASLITDLRALAERQSVSLFVVLLSAFYLTLAEFSGQRDIVVGTPTTGRGRREFQGLIGYFNSTVALRTDFTADATVADLLTRVRAVVFGALEHQEVPFDRVVNALAPQRDLSRTPLFDVLYIHQIAPRMEGLGGAGTELFDLDHAAANEFGGLPTGTAKFDLTLVTFEYTDHVQRDIAACLEFSTELFTPRTVAAIGAVFLEILHTMAAKGAATALEALIADDDPETAVIPTDHPRGADAHYRHDTVTVALDAPPPRGLARDAFAALLTWYSGTPRVCLTLGDDRQHGILVVDPDTTWRALREGSVTPAAAESASALHYLGRDTDALPGPATELALSWTSSPPRLCLHYATELFDRESAEAMAADLDLLLRAAATADDRPVHEALAGEATGHVEQVHPADRNQEIHS